MFNDLEAYREAGRKAALAQNVDDAATVRHWRNHYWAMKALEKEADRHAAQAEYARAYAAARTVARR